MIPEIVKVQGRQALKSFIEFPEILYKDCPEWVPALIGDEYDTFDREKNGAFEYCDCECYLAYHGDRIVGRVAAIINNKANELWGERTVRFGWFDFIEDEDVARALTDTVAEWGRKRGCDTMKGPLGFTDMDKEGLLVDGFDKLSPFTTLYNYPYYDRILKEIGFDKDADWTQTLVKIGSEMPPMFQLAPVIEKRYGIHVVRPRSTREMADKYGLPMFHMYNDSFAKLFQFTPLSDRQIKRYIKTYVSIMIPEFVAIAVNGDDVPVGFAFCVPSLSAAVKKCGGRLFPFGFLHVLHALRHNDTLEALMIGVMPEYQGQGVNVLMFKYLHENCLKFGIKRLLLNPELETNFKVQSLFGQYETEPYMRRRAYSKSI